MQCKYGDPTCPCQDGDMCHYEGDNPISVPPEFVRAALVQEFERGKLAGYKMVESKASATLRSKTASRAAKSAAVVE